MEAFTTHIFFFPRLNYGLVAFANMGGKAVFAEKKLLYHLIDEKLGVPESARFDWDKQ
jgi:hypothetical protein